MLKTSVRGCPICKHTDGEVLRTQRFVLPEGHPLANGYDVVCCKQCGFVYADTTVSQAGYDVFYARFSKYEDKQTSTGGGDVSWDAERLDKTAARITEFLPNQDARILDIGCANGGLLKSLKNLGYANTCGIDPSTVCVRNTRVYSIEAHVGSLFTIPEELGLFDCVILSHVMEHVQELESAVQRIQRVTQPDGIAYIEVPDATRYAELVTAPFQDFNTEHINHFSLKCLNNLFQTAGWVVRAQGQKTILSSPNMPYPAAYAVYAQAPATTRAPVYDRDWELREKIQDYIQRSQDILNGIEANLKRTLREAPEVIVWGTGQLAIKLLVETSLGQAHIKAFVDGNPINQGRVLRGVTILAPEQIQGMEEPIIIATILHQKEIAQVIRDKMKLPNPVVLLRPD